MKLSKTITPLTYALGTCAAEIFLSILYAKRIRQQVRLARTLNLPCLNGYKISNIHLFHVQSCHLISSNHVLQIVLQTLLTFLYLPTRSASRLLAYFGGTRLKEKYNFPRLNINRLCCSTSSCEHFSWEEVEQLNWSKQLEYFDPPCLPDEATDYFFTRLNELGFSKNDWFVCLHARTGHYRNDLNRRQYRNCDINSYTAVINEITASGGWVIRIGDSGMLKLAPMERVIDFTDSQINESQLTLGAVRWCKFYLGCQSGPYDLAILFDRPMLTVNMYHWFADRPIRIGDRGITKKVYSPRHGRFLSIEEIFDPELNLFNKWDLNPGYILHDNNSEELLLATQEFLKLLDSDRKEPTNKQASINRLWESAQVSFVNKWSTNSRLSSSQEVFDQYRHAAYVSMASGSICDFMLS